MYQPDPDLASFLEALPKTETHLHLEGAVPWELLQELDAARFGEPPSFWDDTFRYDDFDHFNRVILDHAAAWFTSPDRYARAAALTARTLARQNVCYLETSMHLPAVLFAGGEAGGRAVLTAVRAAFRQTAPQMEVRLFLGMGRDDYGRFGPQIEAALDWPELDGIDLHGVETLPLEEWTPRIWQAARAKGKFTKAHVGEFGPASEVRRLVEVLGIDRVEHGVQAADDPEVVAFLRDRNVTLDVCPVSNFKLRAAPSVREHQIAVLHRAGVRCTVNSDDPFFFGSSLTNEYAALALDTGLSRAELAALARNGFKVALAAPEQKAAWLAELDRVTR
jgi:adenosine deaminase